MGMFLSIALNFLEVTIARRSYKKAMKSSLRRSMRRERCVLAGWRLLPELLGAEVEMIPVTADEVVVGRRLDAAEVSPVTIHVIVDEIVAGNAAVVVVGEHGEQT